MGTEQGLTELAIQFTLIDAIEKGEGVTFDHKEAIFLLDLIDRYWQRLGMRTFPITDIEKEYAADRNAYLWMIKKYEELKDVMRQFIKPEFLSEEVNRGI